MLSPAEFQAWFFDLGGTLLQIEDDEIALTVEGHVIPLPGAIEALTRLSGHRVFVVSNQAAVGLGQLPAMQVYDFIRQINALCGDVVTDFRFAMHSPKLHHCWRKPAAGMVRDLAKIYALDLTQCAMVGDSENDYTCARNANIGAFFWIDEFLSRF